MRHRFARPHQGYDAHYRSNTPAPEYIAARRIRFAMPSHRSTAPHVAAGSQRSRTGTTLSSHQSYNTLNSLTVRPFKVMIRAIVSHARIRGITLHQRSITPVPRPVPRSASPERKSVLRLQHVSPVCRPFSNLVNTQPNIRCARSSR